MCIEKILNINKKPVRYFLITFLITGIVLMIFPCTAKAANPGYVDVTIYHHYDDIASPVREDIEIEAGDYTLGSLFTRMPDVGGNRVYEVVGNSDGSELISFTEGYSYTVNIYYALINKVTFNANGGTPATQERTVRQGNSLGSSFPGNPTRNGYTFLGWNTQTDGTGTAFLNSTVVDSDIEVFAQWRYIERNDRQNNNPVGFINPPTGDTDFPIYLLLLVFSILGGYISLKSAMKKPKG